MGLLGRPIGVWMAMVYLLGMLALSVSNLDAPTWHRSPMIMVSFAAVLLSAGLLLLLNRWAVLATAVTAAVQAAFYLVYLLDPPSVPALLGLGSPAHDVYVVPIQFDAAAPLVSLAATAAVALYATWLWRASVLR